MSTAWMPLYSQFLCTWSVIIMRLGSVLIGSDIPYLALRLEAKAAGLSCSEKSGSWPCCRAILAPSSTIVYFIMDESERKNSILNSCNFVKSPKVDAFQGWLQGKSIEEKKSALTVATGKRIGQLLLNTTPSHCHQDPQPLLCFPASLHSPHNTISGFSFT